MLYTLLALLLLGTLITLHEAGHFWAARHSGIPVREFSMGMGPLLFARTSKKGTRFCLRLLPIGGYCAFYGEDEDSDDPRAFQQAGVGRRAWTVASGPLMNFVVAFAAILLYLSLVGIPVASPEVAAVEENAAQAGLRVRDVIVSVNGMPTKGSEEIAARIAASAGAEVTLGVRRDGEETQVSIQPFYDAQAERYRVGFTFGQIRHRVGLLTSIPASLRFNAQSATLIVRSLRELFQGRNVDDLTGPVGTVYVIQDVTRTGGIDVWMELLALISVNLGIMNLLPIPGLDGSRLLFLLAEAIRRRPVNRRLEGTIHMMGFAVLMGLMLILTYKDIVRFLWK